jgi:hypothetical protein
MEINWHSVPLTLDTVITSSYKNTQNVRRFFKENVGGNFHFDRDFMAWMKANAGKTMQEAIAEAKRRGLGGK